MPKLINDLIRVPPPSLTKLQERGAITRMYYQLIRKLLREYQDKGTSREFAQIMRWYTQTIVDLQKVDDDIELKDKLRAATQKIVELKGNFTEEKAKEICDEIEKTFKEVN